jgi:hypothetical protein
VATDRPAGDRLQHDAGRERHHPNAQHVGGRLARQAGLARQQQRIDEIDRDREDVLERDAQCDGMRGAFIDAIDEIGRLPHQIPPPLLEHVSVNSIQRPSS